MLKRQFKLHEYILSLVCFIVLVMGVLLWFRPPALFPDPGNGFQVLRSMHLGAPFNTLVSPDQSDIAQNYSQFLTWWSPGQYLVPYFFMLTGSLGIGKAVALTVTVAQLSGLTGFYLFFKRIGFSPLVSALSIVFIISQQAFMVPYVFYPGGELLLFAFEGWFLYGCLSFNNTDWKLVLFVLLSGWLGFFFKSSFLWMYVAGLACLWMRLSPKAKLFVWIKKALWIGIPAVISLGVIYIGFLSKGQSPASTSNGLKLCLQTFGFPLACPIISAFSIDDLLHGILFHTGKPFLNAQYSVVLILILALLSVSLIIGTVKYIPNKNYRLFVLIFYGVGVLFLGMAYLRQLTISYEARHFRIIGLLIVPGMIYLAGKWKPVIRIVFIVILMGISYTSFAYVVKGFRINHNAARGITGITQPNIDQPSLNAVLKLDRETKGALFVFISDDIGLEVLHNRIITLQPIGDDLKIDIDDYRYNGFAGHLYIVLPENYNGPKEKLILKSFPGYAGWQASMLSDKYVLYSADMKRQ